MHCPRPEGRGTTAGSVADGRSLSTEGAEEEREARVGWGLQTFIPTWRQGGMLPFAPPVLKLASLALPVSPTPAWR